MRKYMAATAMILTCFLAFIESNSYAFEYESVADLPYRGVRPMGMGNVFAAISDDLDAFYYNPAGIAAVRKLRINLQPIRFIPTQDFYDELSELDQLVDDIEAINESQYPLEDPDLEDDFAGILPPALFDLDPIGVRKSVVEDNPLQGLVVLAPEKPVTG